MIAPRTLADDQELQAMVTLVRGFLRDHAELNRLIDGEETGDRLIKWAVLDAVDEFNHTPPPLSFAMSAMPTFILIRLAAASVLESVGILQTRNHLNFNDSGITVGVSDKTPLILNWITMLRQYAERHLREWKISRNIAGGWGTGSVSPYWYVNGYYDTGS